MNNITTKERIVELEHELANAMVFIEHWKANHNGQIKKPDKVSMSYDSWKCFWRLLDDYVSAEVNEANEDDAAGAAANLYKRLRDMTQIIT